jgi:hypothetical protein
MHEVLDYTGKPLALGDHVEAWSGGHRFTATVTEILPRDPGCGNHSHLVLAADEGGTEGRRCSDQVVVIT